MCTQTAGILLDRENFIGRLIEQNIKGGKNYGIHWFCYYYKE